MRGFLLSSLIPPLGIAFPQSPIIKATDQRIWGEYENSTVQGDLPRRADLGFRTSPRDSKSIYDTEKLVVTSVSAGSPASKSGLLVGDIVISVNGITFGSALERDEELKNLPGEVLLRLEILRDDKKISVSFLPTCEPLEDLVGVMTHYGSIRTKEGTFLRTIVTEPQNTEGKLPAILISDWTSCSSTEVPLKFQRGWINFLRGLIQSTGAIVLRVDKPGCGDSQGRCSELDFNQTIAYQKQALQLLKNHPNVDPDNIFIDGESVGGFIAPLVAVGEDIKGIIVRAAGASTWFERMVTFERKQRELAGKPLNEIDEEMKSVISFFHYYLIQSMPLDEIFSKYPEIEDVWGNQISHNSAQRHYGRPIEFHQQAQSHNFADAWIKSGARALVLYGEFDQYESEQASRTIINAVNSVNPGFGKLIIYPNLNHQLEYFKTREAALKGYSGREISPQLIQVDQALHDVRVWMQELRSN